MALKKHLWGYSAAALGAAALVMLSLVGGLFVGMQTFFEDIFFLEKEARSDIVIIAIDNDSLARIGQWPWPRAEHAQLLRQLAVAAPRAVGYDVLFAEPSRFGTADDAALRSAIRAFPAPLVLPAEANALTLINTPTAASFTKTRAEFLTGNATLGTINVIPDRDGVVRRYPRRVEAENEILLYFTEAMFEASDISLPNIEVANPRIAYSVPPGGFRTVSAWKVIKGEIEDIPKDAMVFVGATAQTLHDSAPTPLSKGTEMPGVEIHANVAEMLFDGRTLRPISTGAALFAVLAASLAASFAFSFFRSIPAATGINTLLMLLITFFAAWSFTAGAVVPFVHINLAVLLSSVGGASYKFFAAEREKRSLRKAFTKYVSKEVLEDIMKNPDAIALGGEEREVTILFSDIRGFTTLSEQVSPAELVRILNTYFTAMSEEIMKTGGVVDKYIGDAIMAFWGAPLQDRRQADHALQAARGMVRRLEKLNRSFKATDDPEIKIGIGLYTGKAIVGNVGSVERFDYTVIGDAVNTASRLEGLTKEHNASIIIGESTKQKLSDHTGLAPLGSAQVKGRAEPVSIYAA